MAQSSCLYGPTGSFKTSQVKWFSRYIAETTGKCTLLLSCDGGGWGACEPEIAEGMIRPYRCDSASVPMPILQMISKGYWPRNPEAATPDRLDLRPVEWDEVGGIAVEGWTSISAVIMRYLPASGISVGGEDRNKLGGFSQTITVDGSVHNLNFRSNTRGDYGFVQNHLYGLVMNFNSLPCRRVLYTALESKTEDDTRTTTYGPSISGKKATAECGAWVGDLLHAQDFQVVRSIDVPDPTDASGKKLVSSQVAEMKVRVYFKKHPDPATSIPFPAKPRVTPEMMAELDKRFPGGYFEPTTEGGLDRYLRTVDELSVSAGKSDALRAWRDKQDAKLGRKPAVIAPDIVAK